ncbi:MAG: GlsB/YeaQ/YmgE family stress response membrane protein [Actinomycetes bacterium]
MTIEGIIGALIIGLIIGALGRLVLPGKQDIPIWLTIVVGIAAALVGSAIVGPMRDTDGVDWVELIVQVALAAGGVALAANLRGRGRKTITRP